MVKLKPSFLERNHLLIAAAVVALFVFSGWMMRRGAVLVHADTVNRQAISSFISTNGKVEPVQNFDPHAPAAGSVKRVLVAEGDHVKAGQLLVELDDADARAAAARAEATLRAAEADLHAVQVGGTQEEVLTEQSDLIKARTELDAAQRNLKAERHLQETGAASPAEVQAASNRMEKAEADVQLLQSKLKGRYSTPEITKVQSAAEEARVAYDAAEETLRHLTITAPYAGTVYQLRVKPGSYVNAGDSVLQMANLDNVIVRGYVDEPDIGRLAKDQKVQITWDAIPGRTWEGKLTRVPSSVTALGSRAVGEVMCEIPNPDHKLLPNINVNVSIITAQRDNALTVPREAVHEFDGRHVVYEIKDGKIKTQDVQIGTFNLTRVEILSGLSEGTEIALGAVNAQPLHHGMEVKVVER
jgi:HlyD family secretion protein